MNKMLFFIISIVAFSLLAPPGTANADDGWMSLRKFKSVSKKKRRAGLVPTGVSCRNSPKAKVTARPEIRVRWSKAGRIKDGVAYLHGGTNIVYPFFPGSSAGKGWRRKKGNSFRAGPSKSIYQCYVWQKS